MRTIMETKPNKSRESLRFSKSYFSCTTNITILLTTNNFQPSVLAIKLSASDKRMQTAALLTVRTGTC